MGARLPGLAMPRYVLQGWGNEGSLNFWHERNSTNRMCNPAFGSLHNPSQFLPGRGVERLTSSPLKLREADTYPQTGIADADALYTAEILPLRRGSSWVCTGDMEKRWDAAFGHTILHDVCALYWAALNRTLQSHSSAAQ